MQILYERSVSLWYRKHATSFLSEISDSCAHKLLMLHDVLGCCENTGNYRQAGLLSLGSAERRRSSQWWTVAAQSMKNQLGSTKLLMLSHIGCWREQITSLWLLRRPIIHFQWQQHSFCSAINSVPWLNSKFSMPITVPLSGKLLSKTSLIKQEILWEISVIDSNCLWQFTQLYICRECSLIYQLPAGYATC